ncbi:MAG: FmdB family zinc ribbon protein [Bryobacterales bacterium]|nr:zinc ribbon domain-containing protein [Bryobacteraceae bacterium]MDW8355753.1 FmdB family zinc ribbon protein [Bryobacterales bacterium]
MPLYEYRCETCGDVFEVMQKAAEAPLAVHEGCGGRLERLISPPAFQFKGTGWYITDYARQGKDGSKSKEGADGKAETSSTSDGKKAESPSAASKNDA